MTDTALSFDEWVSEKRRVEKLTMTECAKRAGVSVQRWQQIEVPPARKSEGFTQPRREVVSYVCNALGVPLSEGLAAAGYTSDMEITDSSIQVYFENMKEEGREMLLDTARMLYKRYAVR